MFVPRKVVEDKLLQLLAEGIGQGDVTTAVIVPERKPVEASIIAKESGTVAGIEETLILAEALGLEGEAYVSDGAEIERGQAFLKVSGDAQTILSAERTMLHLR